MLVEEGLLLLLVLAGAYLVPRIMGRGLERHLSQWGISWAVATSLAAVWTWSSFAIADVIRLGVHPTSDQERGANGVGFARVRVSPLHAVGGILLQVAVAVALASLLILIIGHTWAG